MKLYHYRSISSALLEIENGTFHFASKEELNDPLEGFVRVFWQGDKMAWEGLFRHYIYSVARALELYILKADDETLYHGTLVADVHCYKNNFFEKILLKLGEEFITDIDVQNLAGVYGDNCLKVSEKELQYILFYIHNNALIRCLEEFKKNKFVPAEEAEKQIKLLNFSLSVEKLVDAIKKVFSNEKMRVQTIESMEEIFEEMKEFSYIIKGAENDIFLHGKGSEEQIYNNDGNSVVQQHRKWLIVMADFPKVFVAQLRDMIYPKSYVVCFSKKNDNSAMWGNYADCHKGVCLIYDTGDEAKLKVGGRHIPLDVRAISYGGESIECNFFQTLGRLTMVQIREWLLGVDGVSSCYEAFSDVEEWRKRYWKIYDAKTYRKTKNWEHEKEFRVAVSNTFGEFDVPQKQNMSFDWNLLKGVIFGIRTSEYDKKQILDKLIKHKDELSDFTFYQAEYSAEEQKIKIRKKKFWRLINYKGKVDGTEKV